MSKQKTPRIAKVSQPTADERLRWLLEFVHRDVSALRKGELYDVYDDLIRHVFVGEPGDDTFPEVTDEDDDHANVSFADLAEVTRPFLQQVQEVLLGGLNALDAGNDWSPFGATRSLRWSYRVSNGALVRRYEGRKLIVTLAAATDLLVQFWPEIRRCEYPSCRRFFLPTHGRQRFHDPKCSGSTRQERFKPRRDYNAEKERRALRNGPGRGQRRK